MSLKNKLFKASRVLGKASSVIADVEAVSSMDKKRITKRLKRKIKNKTVFSIAKKITKEK